MKQSKSALHVEDDRTWQRMVGRYLKEAGYDVTQTDNLQDAEGHTQRQRFDVYVVDGRFPLRQGLGEVEGAGFQLYERIRQVHKGNLNYAILSGDVGLQRECIEKGITFFYI